MVKIGRRHGAWRRAAPLTWVSTSARRHCEPEATFPVQMCCASYGDAAVLSQQKAERNLRQSELASDQTQGKED
jgi:hypothetical protein